MGSALGHQSFQGADGSPEELDYTLKNLTPVLLGVFQAWKSGEHLSESPGCEVGVAPVPEMSAKTTRKLQQNPIVEEKGRTPGLGGLCPTVNHCDMLC